MIEVTIKTLDAQNHHFTVPSDYTVEQLKEHIAETIQIPSEAQRCIYLGQVLQNDTKLADCDVHGKVIHVVQRPPPSAAYTNGPQNSNNANAGAPPGARRHETHTGTMYLGAMAFPSDFMETGGLTFLHPRTNLSVSRLVVARNLLRRAINIINQLESENYFSSNQEQSNQSQSRSGSRNLGEDIANSVGTGGIEQPDVEIRIELPNSQHDSIAETIVGPDDGGEIPDPSMPSGSVLTDPPTTEEATSSENTSSAQAEGESNAAGGANREDSNRRRGSRTPMMATVMGAVLHAQVRLIPFMRLLRQYLLQDTAFGPDVHTTHTELQVQSLYNSVSELMHYFAHIYHSLSDIMCDFSQPPPRTLRCRPVILQQQHATVLRSGPRRSTIIRSPVLAVSRSTSTAPSAGTETAENPTASTSETGIRETDEINRDAGTSSVEVVIEEADTTNMQENQEEGIPENMDTSEPIVTTTEEENNAGVSSNAGGSTVTVRGRSGNTYVIQSMPDGVVPEGIRINSVEATILTPNEDIAAALTSGTNQRWRAGILPAEVLHNMFGFINQFRQSHRPQRGAAGERPRQPNSGNGTDSNQTPANSATSETSQPQNNASNNATERSIEFDIAGLSRTFDPFLPCHSHHIHPILSRASNTRNATTTSRNSTTQGSSSSQSVPPSQTQTENSQATSQDQQQSSQESQSQQATDENQPQSAQPGARRNENDEGLNIPGMPRHVSSFFNNIFPSFNIGNVMIRRGSMDGNNITVENDSNGQGRQSARARIQLTSNLNAIFPGAIQIEIDPLTNNIQTNIVPDDNTPQPEVRTTSRRTRTASKRSRRANGNVNATANGEQLMSSSTSSLSTSSTSPASSPSSSISSSDEELEIDRKGTREKQQTESNPSKTIKNLFSLIKKENIRHLTSKKTETESKVVANNYPLYVENQEASFLDIINAVVNGTPFQEIIRGGEVNVNHLTSTIRQKLRSYLIEHRNIINGEKNGLLNAVNIFINNDLFKMRNLLDSDCVKQEIDLVSTICKFNHDSVPELIECIVKSEDLNEVELRKFCKSFHFYVARLLTLFVHCISGEDKSIHIKKVLGSVIEEVIKSLPKDEELVRWLRKDLINHVISYSKISRPDNLPAFMSHYVVYRLPPIVPIECTVATATIANIGDGDIPTPEQTQPMEIDEAVQSSSSASSEVSFVSLNSEDTQTAAESTANNNAVSNENQPSILPVVPPAEPLPEVVLNSEEWHRSFPSEWVPIIARDIHRLRRQGSQPPFSDAYLSGMPTKRRKLIKKNKPDLDRGDQLINGNISAAVDAAGFSASANTISNHVSESDASAETLTEIVKEELKENVRENIVQQSDFLPRRFPDSAKYFLDK